MKKALVKRKKKRQRSPVASSTSTNVFSDFSNKSEHLAELEKQYQALINSSPLSVEVKAPNVEEPITQQIAATLGSFDTDISNSLDNASALMESHESTSARLDFIQIYFKSLETLKLPQIESTLQQLDRVKGMKLEKGYYSILWLQYNCYIDAQGLLKHHSEIVNAITLLKSEWDRLSRKEEMYLLDTLNDLDKRVTALEPKIDTLISKARSTLTGDEPKRSNKNHEGNKKLLEITQYLSNQYNSISKQFDTNNSYCEKIDINSPSKHIAKISSLFNETEISKSKFQSVYYLTEKISMIEPFSSSSNLKECTACMRTARDILKLFDDNCELYKSILTKLSSGKMQESSTENNDNLSQQLLDLNTALEGLGNMKSSDTIVNLLSSLNKLKSLTSISNNLKNITELTNFSVTDDDYSEKMQTLRQMLENQEQQAYNLLKDDHNYWIGKVSSSEQKLSLAIQHAEQVNQMISNNDFMPLILTASLNYYLIVKEVLSNLESAQNFFRKWLESHKKDENNIGSEIINVLNRIPSLQSKAGSMLTLYYRYLFGEEYTEDPASDAGQKKLVEIHQYLSDRMDKIISENKFYKERYEKANSDNAFDDLHQIQLEAQRVIKRQKYDFTELPNLFRRTFELYPCTTKKNSKIVSECKTKIDEISKILGENESFFNQRKKL